MFAIVITASVFFTYNTYKNLNNYIIAQKHSFSTISASLLKEKLDKIVAIGTSHVNNKEFQQLLAAGKYTEALNLESHMLKEMPYIETVNIFSPEGVLKTAFPYDANLAAFYGTNFSNRDYFKAVSKNWEPYAGELIVPIVSIDHVLVLTLIPIKSDTGKILGVLVLNLGAKYVTAWINEIGEDKDGYIYVVDAKGHIISHPTLAKKRELVDFSSLPAVQKALKGQSGTEIGYNSIEKVDQISSYSPVAGYGWGVVFAESTGAAFLDRNNTIMFMVAIQAIILVMLGVGSYLLIRDRTKFMAQRDREEILLNSIGDSVIAIDRNWNVTLWNKSAKDLTGLTKEEALNKPLLEIIKLIREMDRTENVQFIEDVMVTGQSSEIDYPAILIGKDGKDIIVNNSVAAIFDENKEVDGAVIVMRDISKKREDLMLHSDFAYASHQLRTPVTEALWTLEAVLESSNLDEIKKNAKIAHTSIQSVKKLSEELITVSEIDQGEVSLDITDVNLQNMFDEILEEIGKKAEEYSTKIQFPTVPIEKTISTDQKLLKRIILEIIDNAIVYGAKSSRIFINYKENESHFTFEIQDFGIGIDAEHQPLIFTKFFRGSNFTTSEIAGAGLGLYIARGYVKLLKGKIWFKSEEKSGTTFFIAIPFFVKKKP